MGEKPQVRDQSVKTEEPAVESISGRRPEKEFKEPLYRSVSVGELFMLWRDKELPLGIVHESQDSDARPNTLRTFWFKQPVLLKYSDALLEKVSTEAGMQSVIGEEGIMRFRFDHGWEDYDGTWHKKIVHYEIPEVTIAQRLKLEQIRVRLSDKSRWRLEQALMDYEELMRNIEIYRDKRWTKAGSTDEQSFNAIEDAITPEGFWRADCYGLLNAPLYKRYGTVVYGEAVSLLNEIFNTEFGDSLNDERYNLADEIESGSAGWLGYQFETKPLTVLKRLRLIREFLSWLLSLPVIHQENDQPIILAAKKVFEE